MKKYWLVASIALVLIAVLVGNLLWMTSRYQVAEKKLSEAQGEIEELREVKKRSVVMSSVSEQMGEIANAEKQNALQQASKAEKNAQEAREAMNEAQRQSALANQARAVAEEKSLEAERQHLLAEEQRKVAVEQKTAALAAEKETMKLRLRALGSSLASMSITHQAVGNHDLAQRLAHASWQFTQQNGGSPTDPLQALIFAANGVDTLLTLRGGITAIDQQGTRVVCVSKYGEVYLFTLGKPGVFLCNDSRYDFREVRLTPAGKVYARDRKDGWLDVSHHPFSVLPSAPAPRQEDILLEEEVEEEEITATNSQGDLITLQGMRSKVTGIARHGHTRIATSMDGTLRMWDLDSDLHMPTTLYSCDSWIYCMHYDSERTAILLGTSQGRLIDVCVNPSILSQRIPQPLSESEWNEFVGSDIPYNTYK